MRDAILDSALVVVGPGRAGTALAGSWARAGGELLGVVGRTSASTERAAREIGTEGRSLETIWDRCGILVIAVPDDRIAATAEDLAARVQCPVAFHLSGALPAAILRPLTRGGASIGSLHPLRAFTGDPGDDWKGALVAVEGDARALEAGERLASALGAEAFRISPAGKPLYHAAATLAAGGTMALLSIAVRAAADAGVPEEKARVALAQLASESAAATARHPHREAFTGPIARRDTETVRAHRDASADRSDFFDLYARLAREILESTSGRGGEDAIRAILEEAAAASPGPKSRNRRP